VRNDAAAVGAIGGDVRIGRQEYPLLKRLKVKERLAARCVALGSLEIPDDRLSETTTLRAQRHSPTSTNEC